VQKPFDDVADFMKACGQTVGVPNEQQSGLYWSLIDEEYAELEVAEFDSVGELDAVVDLIVVLVGYAHSRGWNIDAAWEEVHRSNKAKIDPVTGMVTKRSDGKILKPPGWTPPNLIPAMGANHESN
jgi:predicted HAD superfamily Cof-like phosphohydrolase